MQLEREGILLCLVGPSGSGKTTLAQRLLKDFPDLKKSISTTSRAPRPGEQNGVSYHFLSRDEFEKKIADKALFEYEETHGNYYGTLQSTIDQTVAGQGDLLLDIDIRGALNFRKRLPKNVVVIFLVPPSFAALKERLEGRGPLDPAEFKRRMETAQREYQSALDCAQKGQGIDYWIVNDQLEQAYLAVKGVLIAERLRVGRIQQEPLKQLVAQLTRG